MPSRGSSPLARGLLVCTPQGQSLTGIIPARAGFTTLFRQRINSWQDHPRSRGVYPDGLGRLGRITGSSPLARGLPDLLGRARLDRRIIPARAGFTWMSSGTSEHARDHPRSRGVYASTVATMGKTLGSSPLARGLLRVLLMMSVLIGDHPRSRGVYLKSTRGVVTSRGSSPLARGLLIFTGDTDKPLWIIPARAGFTRGRWPRFSPFPDHPRSRGVYSFRCGCWGCGEGSSPLARGLRSPEATRVGARGIIPARAGFTSTAWPSGSPPRDHPRSRGVYSVVASLASTSSGSSPLARGLHSALVLPRALSGIIPARAGFTTAPRDTREGRRDHPRSRGVYTVVTNGSEKSAGSSPLARGLPLPTRQPGPVRGIIPARAGFTEVLDLGNGVLTDHPRSRGVYLTRRPPSSGSLGSSPLARGLRETRRGHHST